MLIMRGVDSARERLPRVGGRQGEAAAERAVVKLKSLLSNSARDEFSVTLKIAVTIKIDVTEKLSRNLTSATD